MKDDNNKPAKTDNKNPNYNGFTCNGGQSRAGLYLLVIILLLNTCSIAEKIDENCGTQPIHYKDAIEIPEDTEACPICHSLEISSV